MLAPGAVPDLTPILARAETIEGNDREGLLQLGGLLLRAGRHKDAVRRLKEALALRPTADTAIDELLLALACRRLGQSAEARRWLDRATAWLDGQPRVLQAGRVLAAGGSPLMALAALQTSDLPDSRERLLGWQAWLELRILLAEARQQEG